MKNIFFPLAVITAMGISACSSHSNESFDNASFEDTEPLVTTLIATENGSGSYEDINNPIVEPAQNIPANVQPVSAPFIDTDTDGIADETELENGTNPQQPDTDADGTPDGEDAFPNDPTISRDSDGDGVADSRDAFPNDPSETTDLDNNGIGDNEFPVEGFIISGFVTDMTTGGTIANATVRLDVVNQGSGQSSQIATGTDSLGSYSLRAVRDNLPETFLIVGTAPGFIPKAIEVPNVDSSTGSLVLDFALEPAADGFVVLETTPSLHHLGDDNFSGSANSQFQRTSEGSSLMRNFNLTEAQAQAETLTIIMIAKGIQRPNNIFINGNLAANTPDTSDNGSFDELRIGAGAPGLLNAGANSLRIEAFLTGSDLDDFEFVLIGIEVP